MKVWARDHASDAALGSTPGEGARCRNAERSNELELELGCITCERIGRTSELPLARSARVRANDEQRRKVCVTPPSADSIERASLFE
jgi:hypothetical protein